MFQEGSDMEHLVLKVNVGLTEYTIDAIKYVDGIVLKDVRMEGEKTIRVMVSTQEVLSLESLKVSTDGVQFSFLWKESLTNRFVLLLVIRTAKKYGILLPPRPQFLICGLTRNIP